MVKVVRVNVMLCPDHWQELRRRSLDARTSASALLREIIRQHLAGGAPGNPDGDSLMDAIEP